MSRFPKRDRKPIQRFCDQDVESYYRNSPTKRKNFDTNTSNYDSEELEECDFINNVRKHQNHIKKQKISNIEIRSLFLNHNVFVNKLKSDLIIYDVKIVSNEKCVMIMFDGYSVYIEPMVNFTGFQLSLLDSYNKYIELRDIGFSDSIKQYLDYDKLVGEIIRIRNLDYNIECYNQENVLADKLTELKYSVDNTRELYVTIPKEFNDCNIVISYPHNIVGNRGLKYGDPVNPYKIKTDFENYKTFTVSTNYKINVGKRYNYFDSFEDLTNYLNNLFEL